MNLIRYLRMVCGLVYLAPIIFLLFFIAQGNNLSQIALWKNDTASLLLQGITRVLCIFELGLAAFVGFSSIFFPFRIKRSIAIAEVLVALFLLIASLLQMPSETALASFDLLVISRALLFFSFWLEKKSKNAGTASGGSQE